MKIPRLHTGKMAEGRIEGEVGSIDGPVRYASVAFGAINVLTDQKGNFVLDHVPPGLGKISVKSPVTKFRDYEKNILIEDGEGKTGHFRIS